MKTVDRTYNSPINKNDLVSFYKNANEITLNPNEFPIEGQRYQTYAEILAYLFSLPAAEQPSITNPYLVKFNGIINENIVLAPYVGLSGENKLTSKLAGTVTSNTITSMDYFQYHISNCTIGFLDLSINAMELLVLDNTILYYAKTEGAVALIAFDSMIVTGQYKDIQQMAYFFNCTFFSVGNNVAFFERTSEVSRVYFSAPINTLSIGQTIGLFIDDDMSFSGMHIITDIDYSAGWIEFAQPTAPDVMYTPCVDGELIDLLSFGVTPGTTTNILLDGCTTLGEENIGLDLSTFAGSILFNNSTFNFYVIIEPTAMPPDPTPEYYLVAYNSRIASKSNVTFTLLANQNHTLLNSAIGPSSDLTSSNIDYVLAGGKLTTLNLLSINNITGIVADWLNKGGRFNNSISSLPGDPDCFQEAIDALAATGSDAIFIYDQTVDATLTDGVGVDFNLTRNEWTRPNNACQVRGVYMSTFQERSNCIVLKGRIPGLCFTLGVSNICWFDNNGNIVTSEPTVDTCVYAGEGLISGDFLLDIDVEKGRKAPLTTDTVPAVTVAYLNHCGDGTHTTSDDFVTADIDIPNEKIYSTSSSTTEIPGRVVSVVLSSTTDVSALDSFVFKNPGGGTVNFITTASKWDDIQQRLWLVGITEETGIALGFVGVFDPVGCTFQYKVFDDGGGTLFSPTAIDLDLVSMGHTDAHICGNSGVNGFYIKFSYDGTTLTSSLLSVHTEDTGMGQLVFNDIKFVRNVTFPPAPESFILLAGYVEGAVKIPFVGISLDGNLINGYYEIDFFASEITGIVALDSGVADNHQVYALGKTDDNKVFLSMFDTDGNSVGINSESIEINEQHSITGDMVETGKLAYYNDTIYGSYVVNNNYSVFTRTYVPDFLDPLTNSTKTIKVSNAFGSDYQVQLAFAGIGGVGYSGSSNAVGTSIPHATLMNVQQNDTPAFSTMTDVSIGNEVQGLFVKGTQNFYPPIYVNSVPVPIVSSVGVNTLVDTPAPNFVVLVDSEPVSTTAIPAQIFDAGTYWHSKENDPTPLNDGVDSAGLGFYFREGYIWANRQTGQVFLCTSANQNKAIWQNITPKNLLSVTDHFVNSVNKEWHLRTNTSPLTNIIEFNNTLNASLQAYSALRLVPDASSRIEYDWGNYTTINLSKYTYMRIDISAESGNVFMDTSNLIFEFGLVSDAGLTAGAPGLAVISDLSLGSGNLYLSFDDGVGSSSTVDMGVDLAGASHTGNPVVIELMVIHNNTSSLAFATINGAHATYLPYIGTGMLAITALQPWLAVGAGVAGFETLEVHRVTVENER